MHIVSVILRQRLLQHTSVALPGFGTLEVVHHSARIMPGSRLAPPSRSVEFTPAPTDATPLSMIVATELNTDFASAAQLYEQWSTWALSNNDGTMVLEGVGILYPATSDFYPEAELVGMLNPLSPEPLSAALGRSVPAAPARPPLEPLQPKGRNPHTYTISFLALIVVLAALGYLCYWLWTRTGLFGTLLA